MEYFYMIHWIINPVIYIFLTYLFFGRARYLSFPIVFVYSYLLLIYTQALKIYSEDVQNLTFLITVWAIPYIFIIVTGFGLIALGHGPKRVAASFVPPTMSDSDRLLVRITPFVSAGFILLPVLYIIDRGAGGVALFFALSNGGNVTETILLRIGGLTSRFGPLVTSLYSYSHTVLYPVYVSIIVVLRANNLVSKLHFVAVILAAGLFAVVTTTKAPLAFVLGAGTIAYYLSRAGQQTRGKLAIFAAGSLTIPALVYPFLFGLGGSEALIFAVEKLFRRVTWVPSYTSALYFDLFGDVFGHLGAGSNRFLAFIFGVPYRATAAIVNDEYFGSSLGGGLVNASYFASFYADWGIWGPILGTIVVSVSIIWLQSIFDRRRADFIGTGMRAAVLISTIQLMMTNFYSVALGRGFLSLPVLLLIIDVIRSRGQRGSKPQCGLGG